MQHLISMDWNDHLWRAGFPEDVMGAGNVI
jgi:hypothetical protein